MRSYEIKNSYSSIILEINREANLKAKVIKRKIDLEVAKIRSPDQKDYLRKQLRKKHAVPFRTFLASSFIIQIAEKVGIDNFDFKLIERNYRLEISTIVQSLEIEIETRKKFYPIWIHQKKFGLNESIAKNRIQLLLDAKTILLAVAAADKNPSDNITIFSNS